MADWCRAQNIDNAELVSRPADRDALALHRRKEGLGHLSVPGSTERMQKPRMAADAIVNFWWTARDTGCLIEFLNERDR
jgi:hypothetical protein